MYNILGKEIQTLVNENQKAGNYIVDFDASRFNGNIFFYTLQLDNVLVDTRKMITK